MRSETIRVVFDGVSSKTNNKYTSQKTQTVVKPKSVKGNQAITLVLKGESF